MKTSMTQMTLLKNFLYQEKLEESIKRSNFIFYIVDSLYYHLHRINLERGGRLGVSSSGTDLTKIIKAW